MKGKYFTAGLLVGVISATTITAFGAGRVINAWLHDGSININVDGRNVEIPEDMHILEYDGRYYVPTRLIAEELGAEVSWIESRKSIYIRSPEPVIEVVEVERIVEREPEEVFLKAPVRQRIDDVTINIYGIQRASSRTYLLMDVRNDYGLPIHFDQDNAYIKIDGIEYPSVYNENLMWGWSNSIASSEEITEGQWIFEPVPNEARDMKIMIPVVYSQVIGEELTRFFEFNVTFEN